MKLFEIPIFVPKRRYISTIIALIISSAILVSTLSIIIGMNEVSQDLFGTSEDVFVYFNQDTATPFTSRIPMSLMYSFENQNGVKIVSPEIFQPVVIGDESLFIRGVNYSRIFNLENGRLIEGRIPDQSEIYNVMIGKNLKDRMNYQLLQEISFDSLVAEEVVRVKIVGVYETDGITSDEIFTSYPLAMSISGFQANLVTHFRIKYDPSISDENTIINGATQTFAVTFNFETGNSSTQINSMQIKIKDKLENLVKQELFSNSFQLGLLYGEYKLEIINGTNLIYSDSFMVENNFDYNATLFLNVYNVSLQVVYHGNPVHDIEYEIMDDRNTTIISGFSDSIGKLNHNLIEGNYTINFKEGITEQSFDLNVTSTIIDTIELQSLSMINLENIINGSIIPRNIFRLNLENFDSSYLIKLDGSNLNIFSESSFSLPYVSLNLTTGDHNIVVYRSSDSPIILYNIYFSVEPDYELLKTVDLMEGGHYSPNSLHVFDKTSINRFTVIGAIIQSNSPTNTNFTIQLPNNIGFHRIEIVAYDLTNFIIRMTFHIIIENNPLGGGWIAPISHIEVKAGDLVPIWWARNSTNYNINNGTLLKIDEKWYYQVPNGLLDMKNYTSTVTYDGFSFLLNYLYVTAYSNLFRLKNSTSSYLISDIISSEFSIISISNYTFLEVDNLWDLSIKANGRIFQIYDNQILPVFGNNINIVYNLTISSRVIQSSESILFQVRDSLNEIDKPIITMGHNPFIKDGRITFQDIYGSTLNFELNRSGMPYTPIRLFGNTFQLAPGNYSISYYLTTDNKSYRWNLTVPIWHKSLSIKSNYVGNTLGFIISNETVKLPQNEVITSNNRLYLPIANDLVTIDYYKNIQQSTYEIRLSNVAYANYTLNFANGSSFQAEYHSPIILSDNDPQQVNFIVTAITLFNTTHNIIQQINLGSQLRNITVNLDLLLDVIDQKIIFSIYHYELNRNSTFVITNLNSTFLISGIINTAVRIYIYVNESLYQTINQLIQLELNFTIGTFQIQLDFINYNSNSTSGSVELTIIDLITEQTMLILVENQEIINLKLGAYLFLYSQSFYSGNLTSLINQNQQLSLPFKLINTSLEIVLFQIPDESKLYFSHSVLGMIIELSLFTSETLSVSLVSPIGNYLLILNGTWGEIIHVVYLLNQVMVINIFITDDETVLTPVEVDVSKFLTANSLGYTVGEDYLNGFLSGALSVVKIVLITQILIVIIVMLLNFIEIMGFISIESKNELTIMKSIGASRFQTYFSFTRLFLINSATISVIGQLFGSIIIYFLTISNQTVFFGHQFHPNPFNLDIIMLNVGISFVFTIFGIIINSFRNQDM